MNDDAMRQVMKSWKKGGPCPVDDCLLANFGSLDEIHTHWHLYHTEFVDQLVCPVCVSNKEESPFCDHKKSGIVEHITKTHDKNAKDALELSQNARVQMRANSYFVPVLLDGNMGEYF